jgi:hypothetical protein
LKQDLAAVELGGVNKVGIAVGELAIDMVSALQTKRGPVNAGCEFGREHGTKLARSVLGTGEDRVD